MAAMNPLDEDDDQLAGRPPQVPRRPEQAGEPSPRVVPSGPPAAAGNEDPRPDEGPGRPIQAPSEAALLTAADWERIADAQAAEAAAEARRLEELLVAEPGVLRLPAFLVHPLVGGVLVGLAALLGLFLFAQVTSTLAALATLPAWARYGGWAVLAVLTGIVLFTIGRFVVFYLRLKPNQPIRLQSLERLAERTQLRWLVEQKKGEARERLMTYLQGYPLAEAADRAALAGLGLGEEQLRHLVRARAELLDLDHFANSDDWFAAVRTRFQGPLDAAAEARVRYFSVRIGLMTAVAPNALVDTLLTLYCSFMMLADLCRIYNLRVGQLGTAILLTRAFFNAYLAGQLTEFHSVTEAGIQGLMAHTGLHFGSLAQDAAVAKVAGKVGTRFASGLLNCFLLQRLGRYAARLLKPVRTD
jgi:uncharacterized membrane protein YcjF (UPF0283 family)